MYSAIIPRLHVGCEMIDSQRGPQGQVGYSQLNKREWNNYFIKNAQNYR